MIGRGKTLADALVPPRYPPPLTGRLYRNDLTVGADGTRTLHFTDVTAGMRRSGPRLRHGRGDRRLRQRRPARPLRHQLRTESAVAQQGDGTFEGRDRRRRRRRPGRWSRPRLSSTTTATAGSTSTSATTSPSTTPAPTSCRSLPAPRTTAARRLPVPAGPPLPQPRRRHLRGRHGPRGDRPCTGAADPRRRRGRLRRRRLARPLRRPTTARPTSSGSTATTAPSGRGRCSPAPRSTPTAPQASMGVDAGDFDDDGDLDIILTHLTSETNTLYLNDGHGLFDDHSQARRPRPRRACPYTGFGTGVARLRQRRLARSADGQRRGDPAAGGRLRRATRSRCASRSSSSTIWAGRGAAGARFGSRR